MDKICRCIRTNEGTAEEPVYTLGTEDSSPAPSNIIAPEAPPVLGPDGLAELWYWTLPDPEPPAS